MEIVLVRHGKPTAAIYPSVNASGFATWVRRYNHSGISADSRPENEISEKFSEFYIVSSDLKRAIESTQIYFNKMPTESLKLFREVEIPRYKLPFTLKASYWLVLNRILWICGLKGPFESNSQAKKRAKIAAQQLIKLANKHDKVVLVSHCYINFYIRGYLSRNGWHLTEKSNSYWGVTRLKT